MKSKEFRLHNEILGIIGVDHIDGDKLNNLRDNLRPATAQQQAQNTRKRKGCSSRFKGVCFDRGCWRADITPPGQKQFNLGFFNDEQSAAQAYDEKAKVLFGAFAKLNFPTEQEK